MLKTRYPAGYLKKEEFNSEVSEQLDEVQYTKQLVKQALQQRSNLIRLKRSESDSTIELREPISIFQEIKDPSEKQNLEGLLNKLRSSYSDDLKIGVAVKTGDCFFDSVAQGLNELKGMIKNSERFNVKSLREDCANNAKEYKDKIIKDAKDYFVPQKDVAFPHLSSIKDEKGNDVPNVQGTLDKYSDCIKNMATENGPIPIWGRPEIEGQMISDKYELELYFYSVNEEGGQKITVTKITPGSDDQEVFIEGVNLDELHKDSNKQVVRIINYKQHFVPLLSGLEEDIKEAIKVSRKEVYGLEDRISSSLIKDIGNYDLEENINLHNNQAQPIKFDTEADGNCFFHAVFGDNSSGKYKAKKAQDMRMEWHDFLSQFTSLGDSSMPDPLRDQLGKVFGCFLSTPEELTGGSNYVTQLAKETNDKIEEAGRKTKKLKEEIVKKFRDNDISRKVIYSVIQRAINERNARSTEDQKPLLSVEELLEEKNKERLYDDITEDLKSCALILNPNLSEEEYGNIYDPTIIKDSFFNDEVLYKAYLTAINNQNYYVFFEEIPILASLADITISVYYNNGDGSEVFKPNRDLLGDYQSDRVIWGEKGEAVISHEGNHFSYASISHSVHSENKVKRADNEPKPGTSNANQGNQQSPYDGSQSDRDNKPIDSAQHHQINLNSPDLIDSNDEREKNTELLHNNKAQLIKFDTEADGNCFFHAVFGDNSSGKYKAKKAQDMRMEWHDFLSQFTSLGDSSMPDPLRDQLGKVFGCFLSTPEELTGGSNEITTLAEQTNKKIEEAGRKTKKLKEEIVKKFRDNDISRKVIYSVIQRAINERNARSTEDQKPLLSVEELLEEKNKERLYDDITEDLKSCALILNPNLSEEEYGNIYDPTVIKDSFFNDEVLYKAYLTAINNQNYYVFFEEIPILASLADITISVYYNNGDGSEVFKPNRDLLGDYQSDRVIWGEKGEAVISHEGNHFSYASISHSVHSENRVKKADNEPKPGPSNANQGNRQSPYDGSQSDRDNKPIDSAQHHQINLNSPDLIDSNDERKKNTGLFSAIEKGELQKVQKLLENIIDKTVGGSRGTKRTQNEESKSEDNQKRKKSPQQEPYLSKVVRDAFKELQKLQKRNLISFFDAPNKKEEEIKEEIEIEKKIKGKIWVSLKALDNLIKNTGDIKKFTYKNVNIFVLFLEAFALQDVEIKEILLDHDKTAFIKKHFGEENYTLIKELRTQYMHRKEETKFLPQDLMKFVKKPPEVVKVDIESFFCNLKNYVKEVYDKWDQPSGNTNNKDITNIFVAKFKVKKKGREEEILNRLDGLVQKAYNRKQTLEEQEEIMFDLTVNIIPFIIDDLKEEFKELIGLRNELIHNFHKYTNLSSRMRKLKNGMDISRSKLFKYSISRKMHNQLSEALMDQEPDEMIKDLEKQLESFNKKPKQENLLLSEWEAQGSYENVFFKLLFPAKDDDIKDLVSKYLKFMAVIDDEKREEKNQIDDEGESENSEHYRELSDLERRKIFEDLVKLEEKKEELQKKFCNEYGVEESDFNKMIGKFYELSDVERKKIFEDLVELKEKKEELQKKFCNQYGVEESDFNKIIGLSVKDEHVNKITGIVKSLRSLKHLQELGKDQLSDQDIISLYDCVMKEKKDFLFKNHENLLGDHKLLPDTKKSIEESLNEIKKGKTGETIDIEDTQINVAKVVHNILKVFYNAYNEYQIKFDNIKEAFSDKIFLDFLVRQDVKLGRGKQKFELKNPNYVYRIIKKLLKAEYTAPYIASLIVKVQNDEVIEKDDLKKLIEILLKENTYITYLDELLCVKSKKLNLYEEVFKVLEEGKIDAENIRTILGNPEHAEGVLDILGESIDKLGESIDKDPISDSLREVLKLLNDVSLELIDKGKYDSALKILVNQKVQSLYTKVDSSDLIVDNKLNIAKAKVDSSDLTVDNKLNIAKAKNAQGKNKRKEGKAEEAKKLYEKAQEVLEKAQEVLGKTVTDTPSPRSLLVLSRQAYTYGLLGNHEESYNKYDELHCKVIKLALDKDTTTEFDNIKEYKEIKGSGQYQNILNSSDECKKYLDILAIRKSMGYRRSKGKKYEEALKIYKGVLTCEKEERDHKEEYKSILPTMKRISFIHSKIGEAELQGKNYEKAQQSYLNALQEELEVLQKKRKIYGSDRQLIEKSTTFIIKVLRSIAFTHNKLGDLKSNTKTEALNHYEEALKEALKEEALKHYEEALNHYEEALRIYGKVYESQKKTLGEDHSDTLQTMQDIAFTHNKLSNLKSNTKTEALNHYEEALKEALNHYKEALNHYEKALQIYKKVYEYQKETLGEDHSDTLQTIKNMVNVYLELGKLQSTDNKGKAIEWYKEEIKLRNKLIKKGAEVKNNGENITKRKLWITELESQEKGKKDNCPSSSSRRKREVGECELSWDDDIEKVREGENDERDVSSLKIDSDKLISFIKTEPMSKNKLAQLLDLADKVQVMGQSQGLINKLISNQKFMNHLNKVGMVSGIAMHGMMGKATLASFLNHDYEGVAINLGFIASGQGFAKVAEAISLKGMELASNGKVILGRSLKAASPLLARGTSAFIAYDLYNQIQEYKKGNSDTLVNVVGDGVYLGVDSAEIGIEIAEGFEVLEGVSSVTGPIGATIGAVVFVGTDVYQAVKKVENIDRFIHLTAKEKFLEGIRAFIGIKPKQQIEELIEEKQLYNQLVTQALEYLKQHSDVQRYVFPTMKPVVDDAGKMSGKIDLDNVVLFSEKRSDIKLSRTRPDEINDGKLFCLPKGNYEQVSSNGSYLCENAMGLEYFKDRTGNYTYISLGNGTDTIVGFPHDNHVVILNNGHKDVTLGDGDDTFVLEGNNITGIIRGGNGTNTLDLEHFAENTSSVNVSLSKLLGYVARDNKLGLGVDGINNLLLRRNKQDYVQTNCDTRYIDGRGGEGKNNMDTIAIAHNSSCSPEIKFVIRPYTKVDNNAENGNFVYIVPSASRGESYVNLKPGTQHIHMFNYTLYDVDSIDVKNATVNFNFMSNINNIRFEPASINRDQNHYTVENNSFNVIINGDSALYQLKDNTEIRVIKNKLFAIQKTNKSVDEIIEYYPLIANSLKMSIFVQSLASNESIAVGHGNHDVLNNNPEYKSHLVGNGGENIFVVTSGYEKLTNKLPIPEVVLYDVDQENKIDTFDLRQITKQVERDLNVKVKTKVIASGKDLLIRLYHEKDKDVLESNIVQVRLKDGLLTNWYERLHVIMNNVAMKIEEFELRPLPLVFDSNEEIIRIAAEDIDKGNKLVISQKVEDYTFSRLRNDLIMTFNQNASLIFSEFYKNKDMETLAIQFTNKEIEIKDELHNVGSFDDLKEEYRNNTANIINSFNSTEAKVESLKSDRVSGRNKRAVESSLKSAASRPALFINAIVNTFTSAMTVAVQGVSEIISAPFKATLPTINHSSSAQSSLQVQRTDINSTLLLLDVFIRRMTGQKYVSTADQCIPLLEAQDYALNITNEFEKVVKQAASKSEISTHRLNINFMKIHDEITEEIIGGKFNEISGILKSHIEKIEKACPNREAGYPGKLSPKKFDKFKDELNKGLDATLKQEILHSRDSKLEVSNVKGSLKPRSDLNNTYIQGHLTQARDVRLG